MGKVVASCVLLAGGICCFIGAQTKEEYIQPDGATRGGHLLEMRASPTLEVFVTAAGSALNRVGDSESGLALIDPEM